MTSDVTVVDRALTDYYPLHRYQPFKSIQIQDVYFGKINVFQDVEMPVVRNYEVGAGIKRTVNKFVIIGVGSNQEPFIIYCCWFCMRSIKNGIKLIES